MIGRYDRNGRVLFSLAGVLIFAAVITLLSLTGTGKGNKSQAAALKTPEQEIWTVVHGAVMDQSWWRAGNEAEVKSILSRYYSGPLLQELSRNVWDFISRPTDWYWKPGITGGRVHLLNNEQARVEAELIDQDVRTGEIRHGKATYELKKGGNGWRITSAGYHWENENDGND